MTRMTRMTSLLVLFSVLGLVSPKSSSRQMTVSVAAGSEDCFFLPEVKIGQVVQLEYQVTSSSSATGKNDITVKIFSPAPESKVIFESEMDTDGSHHHEAEEEGDYKICLDNKVSTWSDKVVWFEVELEDPQDDYFDDDYMDDEDWENVRANNEDTESLFDMKMEEIKGSVHDVRINMGKMRHFQFMISAQMSKDVNQVGKNLERINFWSVIHLLIMISVGATQVYMVRQLFEDKSQMHKLTTRT